MLETLSRLDTDILLWLNGHNTTYTDSFFYLFSGKIIWAGFYAAIIYAFFRRFGWRVTLGLLLGVGLIITMSDQICGNFARHAFERLRPTHPDNPTSQFVHIVNGYRGGAFGFPSCHAANSFALAMFVSLVFRYRRLTWCMFLWAVLTAYSRIVLGVHYPGDLLVGATVGMCAAAATYYIGRCIYRKKLVDKAKVAEGLHPSRTRACAHIIIGALLLTTVYMAIAAAI